MSGTIAGGLQTVRTIKEVYGEDYYVRLGQLGGAAGHTGGFYANRQLASAAGRIGGMTSTRSKHRRRLSAQRKKRIAEAYKHLEMVQKQWCREREMNEE